MAEQRASRLRHMSRRKTGQRAREFAVAEAFAAHLRETGASVTDLVVGDDRNDPDVLCTVDGSARGIEVVDVPMSEEDARALWTAGEAALYDNVRGPIPTTGPSPELFDHPSGDLLVAAVDLTMRATIKDYAVPTWLVLNAAGVLWPLNTEHDGPRVVAQVTKPAQMRFLDVFLRLTSQNGTSHFFHIA